MDLCHLKNSELEWQFLKYKNRVVLRGDIVKDDSGLHAVFTEQGSSAFITNDSSKSHGYHIQTARMRRTSSRRSICFFPSKKRRRSKMIENFQTVDLGEPTSLLDHVYLECTQRECQNEQRYCRQLPKKVRIQISARATEKLPISEKSDANISSWSHDMEGHAKKCVERHCELENKTTRQLHRVATPCLDDHQFKEEEMRSVGELSKVLLTDCSYLARIGRLEILRSVNKLARAVTKWTKACDKRFARLISYIHHTCEFRQYCHVGNTAQQCNHQCITGISFLLRVLLPNMFSIDCQTNE